MDFTPTNRKLILTYNGFRVYNVVSVVISGDGWLDIPRITLIIYKSGASYDFLLKLSI